MLKRNTPRSSSSYAFRQQEQIIRLLLCSVALRLCTALTNVACRVNVWAFTCDYQTGHNSPSYRGILHQPYHSNLHYVLAVTTIALS